MPSSYRCNDVLAKCDTMISQIHSALEKNKYDSKSPDFTRSYESKYKSNYDFNSSYKSQTDINANSYTVGNIDKILNRYSVPSYAPTRTSSPARKSTYQPPVTNAECQRVEQPQFTQQKTFSKLSNNFRFSPGNNDGRMTTTKSSKVQVVPQTTSVVTQQPAPKQQSDGPRMSYRQKYDSKPDPNATYLEMRSTRNGTFEYQQVAFKDIEYDPEKEKINGQSRYVKMETGRDGQLEALPYLPPQPEKKVSKIARKTEIVHGKKDQKPKSEGRLNRRLKGRSKSAGAEKLKEPVESKEDSDDEVWAKLPKNLQRFKTPIMSLAVVQVPRHLNKSGLGLKVETTDVEFGWVRGTEGLSYELGIQIGWKMMFVDGLHLTEKSLMKCCKILKSGEPCQIVFETNPGSYNMEDLKGSSCLPGF